ncbi:T9SS type B sorting domain-containing protein [Mangrovibacterium diazotrophicum]|uniref:CHU domain-containing protein n=1 Tax=Mangrovibacterium diazotrophicum TaxID=1261403 RepID=A0A419WAM6_9BACT|nr:gliding motility-associated C-terminal domain-containing protein [Mangrovibacterium diazotrophicum]RKD92507.1 CHU domain-containing protein [Mangrovibacterium diazotrophicum]
MKAKSWYFLLLGIILFTIDTYGRPIWFENFEIAEKGYWGDDDGLTIHADLSGITKWFLNVDNCSFTASNDYVKTVSTSGGRFEALDCDGEAVWTSEWIRISGESSVSCKLTTRETGSGKTETSKYIHVFYRLDDGPEQLFEINGISAGNWGEAVVEQTGLQGDSLQIVIRLNTSYASDKIIVDDILVESQEPPLLPENLAAAGDLLINEILFNPYPDCDDFVEVVNVSNKELRTDHLFIASRDSDGNLKQVNSFSAFADYLAPGAYLLLCEKPDSLPFIYPQNCAENFMSSELPSMPNDGGVVALVDDSLNVIDELIYDAKMHHPSIADEEGISLERRSVKLPTSEWENWTSAASVVGFATPGCPNSMLELDFQTNSVTFEPDVISPNNDGYNDFTNLHFELSEPEWLLNVLIFDVSGRLIDQPQKNVTIGQTADLNWQGQRSDGELLAAGIYVFYIELTNLRGERKVFRKSCTIVNKIM